MAKNITLKLDESVLRRCKELAVEDDKSVSQWVSDLIMKSVMHKYHFQVAKKRSLKRLEKGMNLGGAPLSRTESHER